MTKLFKRVSEATIGNQIFNGDKLTIYFTVPFDDGAEANICNIKIYNLSNDTINKLKNKDKVFLNAGYVGNAGSILDGFVKAILTNKDGVDKITTIDVIDGKDTWYGKPINITYKTNTTGKQILSDLAKKTGLGIGNITLPINKAYTGGKTLKMSISEAINEIANECGAKSHVNRGKLYVRPKNAGDNTNILLNADSGLIESPSPIEKEEKYKVTEKKIKKIKKKGKLVNKVENTIVEKTRTIKGWNVKCLLNHRITTDSIITIQSKTANGKFRVESGKHISDGGSFYTEIEVYPA